jgi:hypothetical protein
LTCRLAIPIEPFQQLDVERPDPARFRRAGNLAALRHVPDGPGLKAEQGDGVGDLNTLSGLLGARRHEISTSRDHLDGGRQDDPVILLITGSEAPHTQSIA